MTARIAELEAKLALPPRTPNNSSLPPPKGEKPNLPDHGKKPRPSRPGVARSLAENSSPARRDRLWLLNALVVVLLTLLGAAGEALGYDRLLKSNTAKRRTHSLFRQGRLHALRPNAHHATATAAPADRTLRRDARRTAGVRRYFRGNLKMTRVVRS